MDDIRATEDLFAAAGRYGYLHPSYAEGFVSVGEVRHLRRSGSWMLTRAIEGSDRKDALIGHPHLICSDWLGLVEDLAATTALADVVSLSALTDPLATVDEEVLRPSFPDLVRVEANHHIVDLAGFWPSRDHRRAVREAMRRVDVEVEDAPADFAPRWDALAGPGLPGSELGLPPEGIALQQALPGCVAFSVFAADGPAAASVVYVSGDDAHLHAMTTSDTGRELGADFALVQAMVDDMAGRGLHALDLGSVHSDPDFLAGWTRRTRPSYRCGRIVDRVAYDELTVAAGTAGSGFFPAYRDPAARLGSDSNSGGTT